MGDLGILSLEWFVGNAECLVKVADEHFEDTLEIVRKFGLFRSRRLLHYFRVVLPQGLVELAEVHFQLVALVYVLV